jgi:hypothetical protein
MFKSPKLHKGVYPHLVKKKNTNKQTNKLAFTQQGGKRREKGFSPE